MSGTRRPSSTTASPTVDKTASLMFSRQQIESDDVQLDKRELDTEGVDLRHHVLSKLVACDCLNRPYAAQVNVLELCVNEDV